MQLSTGAYIKGHFNKTRLCLVCCKEFMLDNKEMWRSKAHVAKKCKLRSVSGVTRNDIKLAMGTMVEIYAAEEDKSKSYQWIVLGEEELHSIPWLRRWGKTCYYVEFLRAWRWIGHWKKSSHKGDLKELTLNRVLQQWRVCACPHLLGGRHYFSMFPILGRERFSILITCSHINTEITF